MASDLLLELGSEELPASFIQPALDDLQGALIAKLQEARLAFGEVRTYGTPRRLAVLIKGVAERQDDAVRESMGPPVRAAFGEDGRPTQAATKFAESVKLPVEKLERKQTPKGEYLCARVEEKGRSAQEVLPPILDAAIQAIHFKKSMRWGNETVTYARPLHWIVALLGAEVVPVQLGPVRSGRITSGHRFLDPAPITLASPDPYVPALERAHVCVAIERRREKVHAEAQAAAREAGGQLLGDPALLDTVTNLVEWPSAVLGSFDPGYLDLPPEVLVSEMKGHQKYFSVIDAAGKLLPRFVAVSNTPVVDPAVSRHGYERVLRARLADARFFFDEDQKRPLKSRVDDLKKVVFQQQLGTSYEKMERFRDLAGKIAAWSQRGDRDVIHRAATLCKADLVTGMVGEFPELQGVVGREYARKQGEGEAVAVAIDEHYLPRSSGDRLPASDEGAIIGIADRIDTICGIIGIGKSPTGAADPFGLRRACLAVIRIVLGKQLRFSLDQLVASAVNLLTPKIDGGKSDAIRKEVLEFFRGRLKAEWTQTHRPDVVEAVLAAGSDDLVAAERRLLALSELVGHADFEPLAAAFKRAVNIVQKQAQAVPAGEVDAQLFAEAAERNLFKAFLAARSRVDEAVKCDDYATALKEITALKPPIDGFFDQVKVMADDARVRDNRVRLLREIGGLFARVADFGQIQAGEIQPTRQAG